MSHAPLDAAVGGALRPTTEPFALGAVTLGPALAPAARGIAPERHPAELRLVHVDDPYVTTWSDADRAEVAAIESECDALARSRREAGYWQRAPGTAYTLDQQSAPAPDTSGWGDPVASAAFFQRVGSRAACAWQTLVPAAKALLYLSDPWHSGSVHTKRGTTPIDGRARRMLSLVTDAIGVRARATVMAHLVEDLIAQFNRPSERLRWMSVACGTALPAMKASVRAAIRPELLLVDFDTEALRAAGGLASTVGFAGVVHTKRMNIFNVERLRSLGDQLAATGRSPDLVDLMGIFEYSGSNLGVDPVAFLGAAWHAVAPGGTLILGQMLADRPLPDFAMGVVQWPYVEMRHLDKLLQITVAAGLPLEHTRVHLPSDGVYAVISATKSG